jgi:predicted amidohydrolase YtcJ
MAAAGVDRNTIFTEGGAIIRDAKGDPSGIFVEHAAGLIGEVVPARTREEIGKAYDLAVEECLHHGITTFHDAGADQRTLDLYAEKIDKGQAGIRIYAMLQGSDRRLLARYFDAGPVIGYGNDFLTVRAIKLFSDGALGSRGAWLLDPYEDLPRSHGHSTISLQTLDSIADRALQGGFQVCVHAIGDRANREVLNVYESVFSRHQGLAGNARFRIEHAQHLHPDDIPRFAALQVLPAMQSIHMASDRPWAIDRLGAERIESGAYMWQALLQSGARIINGTDSPVEPIDPLACFYAAVTRKTLTGEPPGGYESAQKMTRKQALRSYTIDAAYGAFEEHIKGSIEVGKVADLVVFDRNIMVCAESEILQTMPLMTMVDGLIAFSHSSSF